MTKRTLSKKARRAVRQQRIFPVPTVQQFYAARTAKGGWTGETLAQWGVFYPLPKGWQKRLLDLAESGQTQWGGWANDQKPRTPRTVVHSVDAILRGMMGMGT